MWYLWTVILLVSRLVSVTGGAAPAPVTTRSPPRTLDRQAAELAWRTWLQSPESGNQNAPPRRITTKSLFITPLVCPKGQRLDSNGCVQVVTVNKDEHVRILLEQLNALFTSAPSGDVVYDYGDEEPGPLQLSIPISLDPQAQPLQAQEPSAQAQEQKPSYTKPSKKNENPDAAAGLVAELELLQLQHSQHFPNESSSETADILNHNVLQAIDKPKRGTTNSTEEVTTSDEGQKEVVYGHVNVDPVLYNTEIETETETQTATTTSETDTETPTTTEILTTTFAYILAENDNTTSNETAVSTAESSNTAVTLKKEGEQVKLNPETEYANIGEAIKLISRYAEVTTDDNFGKDQKKFAIKDDSILGTRTKLQYRRNKPKPEAQEPLTAQVSIEVSNAKVPIQDAYQQKDIYYRYPWQGQNLPTPPPDYPFRHIQDYWPGRNQVGGVYNMAHENPRRHHHAFPHNYFRPHGLPYGNYPVQYPGLPEAYPGQFEPYHRVPHRIRPRSHTTNQDLYTLLGLRHWFSSEGFSKR